MPRSRARIYLNLYIYIHLFTTIIIWRVRFRFTIHLSASAIADKIDGFRVFYSVFIFYFYTCCLYLFLFLFLLLFFTFQDITCRCRTRRCTPFSRWPSTTTCADTFRSSEPCRRSPASTSPVRFFFYRLFKFGQCKKTYNIHYSQQKKVGPRCQSVSQNWIVIK